MKKLIFAPIVVVLFVGCQSMQSTTSQPTAFKGMELYSWGPSPSERSFSLLIGTNRNKSPSEITAPEVTISNLEDLKKKLSELPKGENVFFYNVAKEPISLKIKRGLRTYSKAIGINLKFMNK